MTESATSSASAFALPIRINFLVPPSTTRECNSKALELLKLLQFIAAHLQRTPPWFSGETEYLDLFGTDFHSSSVARSKKKQINCVLKALLRRC